jgi:pyruvate,water dikinase
LARPDFPVVWEEASDQDRPWRLDRLHHPDPIAPLDFWLFCDVVRPGIISGARRYGNVQDYLVRRINTYLYVSVIPGLAPDGPETDPEAAMLGVRDLWEDEILPEVAEHLAWWSSVDLGPLSMDALLDHLDETVRRAKRVWHLHFCITQPAFSAVVELTELYLAVTGGSDLDAFKLIQGFGNKTVEAGRELWKLARTAAQTPNVTTALGRPDARAALAELADTDAGRAWLADFRGFLDVYGRRSNGFGIADPSWIEDPSAPLDAVRRFLSKREDPEENVKRLGAEREAAVVEARERFAAATPEQRMRFEQLLPAAQAGNVITEDHGFYIDFATNNEIRRVLVEAGRRLAQAGVLDVAGDIALLDLDEILETARAHVDRRELVSTRRSEMERFSKVHPPEFLGAKPAVAADDPRTKFIKRFMGPPTAGVVDGELRGAAGAPGRFRGVARLVLDLADAAKLGAGEILVTRSTTPSWTPLFAVAGAVVTDGGGALSHCAIVSREYGIPAVVGTMSGTVTISDGQIIEVDGNQGVVRLLSQNVG